MNVHGKIKLIGELQTFDSGFSKVEVIVTTAEQYPQDIKIELVKDKAAQFIAECKAGQDINVHINLRGNEYNGKYYVNVQGWRWEEGNSEGEETSKAMPKAKPVDTGAEDDDLPF